MSIEVAKLPHPIASRDGFANGRARMLEAVEERQLRQEEPRPWWSMLFGGTGVARPPSYAPVLRAALSAVVLFALAAAGAALVLFSPARVVYQVAAVDQVTGVVEAMTAGVDSWHPVSAGEYLENGASLRTGSQASARLTLSDGSTVGLESETELVLTSMSARRDGGGRVVVIDQATGHVYAGVPPLPDQASVFEIQTPSAAVTVRGTEFSVQVERNGTTCVTVVEGMVDVVAQDIGVEVRAGQEVTVLPDHPPTAVRRVLDDDDTTEPTEAVLPPVLDSPEPTEYSQELPTATDTPTPRGTSPASPTPSDTPPESPTQTATSPTPAVITDTPIPPTPIPPTPIPPTPIPPTVPPTDVVVIIEAAYTGQNQVILKATSDGGYDPDVTLTANPGGVMEQQGDHYHIKFTLTGCPCTIIVTSSKGGWASVTVGP
jgi:hypothetical protein